MHFEMSRQMGLVGMDAIVANEWLILHTVFFFHSTRSVAMSCVHASRSKAVLADHEKDLYKNCTVKLPVKVTGHDSATCGIHVRVPETSKCLQCSLKLWRFRHIVMPGA